MSDKELKEFEEFLKNMSDKTFDKITKSVEKEIFSKEFYEELNGKKGKKKSVQNKSWN